MWVQTTAYPPLRLMVRILPFQGNDMGSIPIGEKGVSSNGRMLDFGSSHVGSNPTTPKRTHRLMAGLLAFNQVI
jgi:hypothetical protein